MNLETTFYTLGIIYMLLMIVATIGMVIAAFYVKSKIERIERDVKEKIRSVAAPATIVSGLSTYLMARMINFFKR